MLWFLCGLNTELRIRQPPPPPLAVAVRRQHEGVRDNWTEGRWRMREQSARQQKKSSHEGKDESLVHAYTLEIGA